MSETQTSNLRIFALIESKQKLYRRWTLQNVFIQSRISRSLNPWCKSMCRSSTRGWQSPKSWSTDLRFTENSTVFNLQPLKTLNPIQNFPKFIACGHKTNTKILETFQCKMASARERGAASRQLTDFLGLPEFLGAAAASAADPSWDAWSRCPGAAILIVPAELQQTGGEWTTFLKLETARCWFCWHLPTIRVTQTEGEAQRDWELVQTQCTTTTTISTTTTTSWAAVLLPKGMVRSRFFTSCVYLIHGRGHTWW
jgi:hypothetical protein